MNLFDMAKSAAAAYVGAKGGGNLIGVVMELVEKNGGVNGVLEKFQSAGMGATVQSWLGGGANQPIDAAQIEKVFGHPQIQALAQKFNLDTKEISAGLASFLPQIIDKLSPNGKVSEKGFDPAELLALGKSFLGR
ncbi:MAG: DUF937 domain-containing protein [Proteobacteria bacterium]|nr:MAG: DUF937 domain-containing protein [Pseudomonadota bacterium]